MISQHDAVQLMSSIAGTRGSRIDIAAGEDDCGAYKLSGGRSLVVTTDFTNFRSHSKTFAIGTLADRARFLVLHNVSDLISTGVQPQVFVAAIGIPSEFSRTEVQLIARGLRVGAREAGVAIVGGDTKEAPVLILCGTAMGIAQRSRLWRVSNARIGDRVYITGAVGGVSAAIAALTLGQSSRTSLLPGVKAALTKPKLPLQIFKKLFRRNFRIAATDVSDGLGANLKALAKASNVSLRLYGDQIPIHSLAKRLASKMSISPLEFAFGFGGDLQFLFSAGFRHQRALRKIGAYEIGEIVKARSNTILYEGAEYLMPEFGHRDFDETGSTDRLMKVLGTRFIKSRTK